MIYNDWLSITPDELHSQLSVLLGNGMMFRHRVGMTDTAVAAGHRGLIAHQELLERFHRADVTGELDGIDAPPISQLGLTNRRAS